MGNKVEAILLAIIILLGGAVFGGYKWGQHRGFSDGYNVGKTIGYNNAPKPDYYYEDLGKQYPGLETKYNNLVSQYNDLRTAAINYVNTNQYRSFSPITCHISTFGMVGGSSTTCY